MGKTRNEIRSISDVKIYVERDGSVRVLASSTATDDKIEAAIQAKEYQIFTKLAKWKELNQGKVNREFVNGQSFLYLGRNYRLAIVENQSVPLKISGGNFQMSYPTASSGVSKYQPHKANLAASCGELTPKEIRQKVSWQSRKSLQRVLQGESKGKNYRTTETYRRKVSSQTNFYQSLGIKKPLGILVPKEWIKFSLEMCDGSCFGL